VKVFGARSNLTLETIYGPASTDGFVSVFGQLDSTSGTLRISVLADTSNPPTTEVGYGMSNNNGVTYLGTIQTTVPIRKGEYYQVHADYSNTANPSVAIVGAYNAYFIPLGH